MYWQPESKLAVLKALAKLGTARGALGWLEVSWVYKSSCYLLIRNLHIFIYNYMDVSKNGDTQRPGFSY